MRDARHSGRTRRDDRNQFDFTNPSPRMAMGRSATHRYLAEEKKTEVATAGGRGEEFSESDFKARWWPAPDVET